MNRYDEKEEAVGISMFALIISVVALILAGAAFFASGCGKDPRFYENETDDTEGSDLDVDVDTDTDADSDTDTESYTDSDTDIPTSSDNDTDTETDTTSDTDTDTETDIDTDTETTSDPNHINCEAEPLDCLDVGYSESVQFYGCCWQDVVYWCNDPKLLRSNDCTEKNMVCGVKYWEGEPQYMWCIKDGE